MKIWLLTATFALVKYFDPHVKRSVIIVMVILVENYITDGDGDR